MTPYEKIQKEQGFIDMMCSDDFPEAWAEYWTQREEINNN